TVARRNGGAGGTADGGVDRARSPGARRRPRARRGDVPGDPPMRLSDPDPEPSRNVVDEASLQELAQAMATNGRAGPIRLRPAPEARDISGHGERRWQAARARGWETIPAEVRELSADEAPWVYTTPYRRSIHGEKQQDRMDRRHLEPVVRLHQD